MKRSVRKKTVTMNLALRLSLRHAGHNIEQNMKRKSLKFVTPILLIMIDNY